MMAIDLILSLIFLVEVEWKICWFKKEIPFKLWYRLLALKQKPLPLEPGIMRPPYCTVVRTAGG